MKDTIKKIKIICFKIKITSKQMIREKIKIVCNDLKNIIVIENNKYFKIKDLYVICFSIKKKACLLV